MNVKALKVFSLLSKLIVVSAVIYCIVLMFIVRQQCKKVDVQIQFNNNKIVKYKTIFGNVISDSSNLKILISKQDTATEIDGYETKTMLITYEYNIPKDSITNYMVTEVK